MPADCEKLGINYAVHQSYLAVDKDENLTNEQKRSLLFSLYSFRCLFDNMEMLRVDPILKKYACTFSMDLKLHPEYAAHKEEFEQFINSDNPYIPYGGLCIREENKPCVLRFDVGSEVYSRLVGAGKIAGEAASVPKKHSLFKMVRLVVSLSSADDELKAAWYLIFPYIVMIGAPFEDEEYSQIVDTLTNERVFKSALNLPFSVNSPDSTEELMAQGYPSILIEFLTPYISFKNQKDEKGISHEVARFHEWLNNGRFSEVLEASEKLLDTFPDDDELLLVNLAARVSLNTALNEQERKQLLIDTLNVIEARLQTPCEKLHFFLYYCGVALLGLKRIDEALDKFNEALERVENFKPALLMKQAIAKIIG